MSPALLDPAAPAHTIPRNPSLNGQFSHPLPFNFSSVPMNPSNIGNQTSGSSNYSSSNIGFNASSFSGSASASSRPRMMKLRKQSNSQNLSPTGASDARGDIGFNSFRPLPESKVSGSSASETGTYVSAGLGSAKSGSEVFVFGANTIDSGVPLEKGVVEERRNLRIETEKDFVNAKDGGGNLNANSLLSSSLSGGLESGGFGFGSGYKKSSVIDESIASKLPEEMMNLKIEGQGKVEGIEEVRDVRFFLRANNATNFGVGSSDNVGSSFVKSAEAELPNEFNTKLDIKEPADTLPNQMNNLKIKDSLGSKSEVNVETNDKDYTAFGSRESTSVSDGGKETPLSRKMEQLKLGSGAADCNQPDAGPSSSREFVKEIQMGHFSDALFRDGDKSVTTEFTFLSGMQGKDESGSQGPLAPSKADTKLGGNVASSALFSACDVGFLPVGNAFEVPKAEFSFTSKQDGTGTPFVEFKTPKPKADLFSGLKQKIKFNAKKESMRNTRVKKKGGKLKHPTPVQLWPGQDFVSRESVSQENPEVSESYSPMDISPYQETPAANQFSRENSVTSDESFRLDNSYEATNSTPTVSSDAIDEDLIIATQCLDINEDKSICQEAKFASSEDGFDESIGLGGPKEESVSGAETESFKSAAEEVDYNSDGTVTSRETDAIPSSNIDRHGYGKRQIGVASSWEDISGFNFTFAASSAAQGQLSASKRQQKKKTLLKVGHDSYDSTPSPKVSYASSSVNLFPFSGTSLPLSPGRSQKGDLSISRSKVTTHSELEKMQEIKQESAAIVAAQDVCEKWRQRGNQAYMNGELSKAEECYTEGVNCISRCETSRSCLRVLMLCYSNRAATRMSLGRMRDAIGDCMMAAAIDPNFLKVQLRAANCYLALGEVEDASKYFKRCLQSGSEICVDRKIVVEASDGLQKAQKVLECTNRSAELLKRSTANDAETALEVIAEAVVISSYSERLLEMKAEALFMLRKYDEVIQLCDQTLGSAEKNFPPADTSGQQSSLNGSEILKNVYFRVWRCRLIFKAYFHLGTLEEGLAVLEQEEESITDSEGCFCPHKLRMLIRTFRSGSKSLESLIPLAGTVRELLRHKIAVLDESDLFQLA
ncbi:hypothetical protein CJ030_MR1G022990 [Morella rubra]|uniref:Uncharacterized protein n=1 Tax=Morella rubra TaxID=262757 RepID=A0A6A1WTJ7_9ROSI|nr:hypothetical protein CJ030_MR1G022990 [Morella rubra]